MTDYKRMVSYMYQYENGVKRKNVGYARVEAKSGQCKITLHMQLLGQLDSVFPTYLIQRGEDKIELLYLGDTMLKNQVMDSKLTADEANIMNTGHTLSEMGGLLLFLNDSIFFATVWDDKPIVAKEVLDALRPRQRSKSVQSDYLKSKSEADTREEVREKKQETKAEKENIPDIIDSQAPVFEPVLVQNELTLEEELKMPKYKFPRGWKTIERFQRPVAAEVSSPYAVMEEAVKEAEQQIPGPEETVSEMEQQTAEPEKAVGPDECGSPEENNGQNINFIQDYDEPQDTSYRQDDVQAAGYAAPELEEPVTEAQTAEATEQEIEQETAKHFFDNYSRIYPFEDNEILLCVKIEPKDIGLLPKETWALSNNSFLMHGFYCYHHLIFAKMKDHNGCIYILGIPGIYHNRERFMARMFGFDNFKSIRRRELRQGDFGYWYLPINL